MAATPVAAQSPEGGAPEGGAPGGEAPSTGAGTEEPGVDPVSGQETHGAEPEPGTDSASGAELGSPGTEPGPEGGLQLIVIDAAPYGVDPVVGRHVSQQLRTTGAALGYRVVPPEASVAAAQRLRMPYPPTPADLWRVTYASESQRGVFARVWAHGGQYVIEVSVASLDGTGPFFARGPSGANDLHAVVDRLLREALPPATLWRGDQSRARDELSAQPVGPLDPDFVDDAAFEDLDNPEPEPERPEPPIRHWQLALQTEGAIGTSQDIFYNHLVGGRLDYRLTRDVILGLYLAYANLRAKDGRANNVLGYLQIENRVRLFSSSDISIPLRLGIGYLPFNGPYVRIAAGINIPISRDFELGFDLLAPTFWVLPDRTAVSMNIAAELVWRL
jgi:hypothetical protein